MLDKNSISIPPNNELELLLFPSLASRVIRLAFPSDNTNTASVLLLELVVSATAIALVAIDATPAISVNINNEYIAPLKAPIPNPIILPPNVFFGLTPSTFFGLIINQIISAMILNNVNARINNINMYTNLTANETIPKTNDAVTLPWATASAN